jgi:hypothetical protein
VKSPKSLHALGSKKGARKKGKMTRAMKKRVTANETQIKYKKNLTNNNIIEVSDNDDDNDDENDNSDNMTKDEKLMEIENELNNLSLSLEEYYEKKIEDNEKLMKIEFKLE